MKKLFFLLATSALFFCGCKNAENGELMGVQSRPFFEDMDLTGMQFIEQGNFSMGAGVQNETYGRTEQPRTMQVGSFFMDETEITNNEYRQFVYWVLDSIVRYTLAENNVGEHAFIEEDELGEPIDYPYLNRELEVNYEDQEVQEALRDAIYYSDNINHKKAINPAKLNYRYMWIDYKASVKKENKATVEETYKGSMFAARPKGLNNRDQFIKTTNINIYPDTNCWMHDYVYSMNEDFTRQYFASPAYDNYPVVGVSWMQARAFCVWRSNYLNSYLVEMGAVEMNDFRLPTEAEWEFAARGGIEGQSYPWGGPYVRNPNGCFIANYEPLKGRYDDDGGMKTLMVGHYAPNDYGLYDMAGNVSEWCLDAYCETSYSIANALSPYYDYDAKDDDPLAMKQKVVRGGSWKDQKYFIQVQTRDYEFMDTCKSYIGFRCVQPYLGRVKGDNLKAASAISQ